MPICLTTLLTSRPLDNRPRWSMIVTIALASCCVFPGCGGEDLSQPPSAIADRLAKQKEKAAKAEPLAAKPEAKAAAPAADSLLSKIQAGDIQPADAKVATDAAVAPAADKGVEIARTEAAGKSEELPGATASTDNTAAPAATAATSTADAAKVDTAPAASAPFQAAQMAESKPAEPTKSSGTSEAAPGTTLDRAAGASIEGEVVTAGGKTATNVKRDKESKESTVEAGMSLLDKLKVPEKKAAAPAGRRGGRQQQVITRTGRFAIAAQTWLQLRTDLARRFFVAATDDARRIAASSGQRSAGVLSTQVEQLKEELSFTRTPNNVLAQTRVKQEITTQPVTNLPGTVYSLELIQNGDVVLIGTEDGRLLARSSATLQDWDLYSQDLFAFQDEHRAAARVADGEVMVVKAVDADRLLTIASQGVCRGWKLSDVVPPLKSPLEMTEQQVRQQQTEILEPAPLFEVQIPDSRIISCSFSESHDLCAIVTSNEAITILETRTGKIVATIESDFLNDTQPVCVVLQEQPQHVLVGLADGRIFRRAFGTAPPLSGTDENGQSVDYQIVFAPDLGDNAGAVTALMMSDQERMLWVGRLDGSVSRFEMARKQFVESFKLHRGPVIELRDTAVGLFTIGADRTAKLLPAGLDPVTGQPARQQTFNLPQDGSLAARVVEVAEDDPNQDQFTRARNFHREVTAAREEAPLFGIRPADPVLALYEHRLRVASDHVVRQEIREQLQRLRQTSKSSAAGELKATGAEVTAAGDVTASSGGDQVQNSEGSQAALADPATFQAATGSVDPVGAGGVQPVAELLTELDYTARPLRRALLSVSDDGTIVAVGQNYLKLMNRGAAPDQAVTIFDAPSATVLRHWRRLPGMMDLSLDSSLGVVLPTPLTARLNLFSGQFAMEDTGRALTWARLPETNVILTGLRGVNGLATDSLSSLDLDSLTTAQGLEGFEGLISAISLSSDGQTAIVNLRERTTIKLLEIDARQLKVLQEMISEPVSGSWKPSDIDLQKGQLGATHIVSSEKGNMVITYGNYPEGGFQLRIWKRKSGRAVANADANSLVAMFKQDDVVVLPLKKDAIEREMTSTPFQFVRNADRQLAVIGPEGLGILNLEDGRLVGNIPLPSVNGRRPVSMLTSDGLWFLAGDLEGQVWVWDLTRPDNLPSSLKAHAGPISGLAISPNGQFLVTAGEENRIRVWNATDVLQPGPKRERSRR